MTVFLVTQHYRPDDTSTAEFLTAIAEEIARDNKVVVISGTSDSRSDGNPAVIELPNWSASKAALVRRMLAMIWFCSAAFVVVLWRARPGTPVFVVTTPFLLPYFVVLAAQLRGAPSALIVYDLYPETLVASRIAGQNSLSVRFIRQINRWLFKALNSIVVIGRDMEKLIAPYCSTSKIHYIPHWSTLDPHERAIDPSNIFRRDHSDKFVIGLSGNLGFTHDPRTVFDAAKALVGNSSVHFILSGWGVGWKWLVASQEEAALPNVTLIERVSEENLDHFLSAADAWIIPYRRNMSGISVPSRLYNLLAMGRPVIALTEPDSELALTLGSHNAGWVVEPENTSALVETILATNCPDSVSEKRRNAVRTLTAPFTRDAAGEAYRALARRMSASRNSAICT